jgi:ADP-heptose:LPS heptosyltransferase
MTMRLLIIRPGAIGDTLLTLPVIEVLRAKYAQIHITLVTNGALLPLARTIGLADETYDYAAARWSGLFSSGGMAPAMRALLSRIDMAICWLRDPDGLVERNLRASGIKQIIVAPGRPPENERIHIVEYLARTIGLDYTCASFTLTVRTDLSCSQAEADVETDLSCPHLEPGDKAVLTSATSACFAIHPGSGGARKCWPISSFATVIQALWRRLIPVLLLAGPADHKRLAALSNQLSRPPRPELLTVLLDLPLLELAHRLQRCRGYLGNDSGITHLAAMCGVPITVLFGPSDPLIWRPCGPSVRVIYHPDLAHLPVDDVIAQILP